MGSILQPTTYFFEDKPLFGLDIGYGNVRVLELEAADSKLKLKGYGRTSFNSAAMTDGVINQPEIIAAAVQKLFQHQLTGDITTKRVAVSLPISHTFTRYIGANGLTDKEVAEAVQTEASQYIPAAIDDLYLDYTRLQTTTKKAGVFIVAIPRPIVDSYLTLTRLLGLEAVVFQTSGGAAGHLFARDAQSDVPTVLVDFGSNSADITVYDNGPIVSGTVASGGEQVTIALQKALAVTEKEAVLIKSKYGLSHSKKQLQIKAALSPTLNQVSKEIKRTIRYFEDRAEKGRGISQIVITGGGANMPGLADYLTDDLRLAVRSLDPTSYLDFGHLQPFSTSERMSYATAMGLACIRPKEVFA